MSQESVCAHGLRKSQCKDCGGPGICEHGRVRRICKDCGGPGICEHGRQRRICKDCGGPGICAHLTPGNNNNPRPPPPKNKKSLNINSVSGYSRFRENLHLKMGGCERLGFEKIPTSQPPIRSSILSGNNQNSKVQI